MSQAFRRRVSLQCETCGNSFEVIPAQAANYNARFCSIACKAVGTRAGNNSVCEHCGTTFYIRPSKMVRHNAGRYCSRQCRDDHWRIAPEANSHWKGGVSPLKYRGLAVEWRNAVLARDGNVCQDCGLIDVGNHAHHLYPWRDWPCVRYAVQNGRTLCQSCHGKTYTREAEYLTHLGLPQMPPPDWTQ